ncbi:hypothetical protein [Nonomuraea indica]|uniref:Uncharacterized protein n=1 Tax=Nonomuraea indica TaxID=1581193 RepID=A0ABW8A8C7_9ACTN
MVLLVFDPITHAAPFSHIARGVLYYSIDLEPEQLVQPPARREVPVPVSAAADWASLRADPDLDTFDGWLRRLRRSDNDGETDVIGRNSEGVLYAYLNKGTPGAPDITTRVTVGSGWHIITRLAVIN